MKIDRNTFSITRQFFIHRQTGGTINEGNAVQKYKFAIGRTKSEQTWLKQEIEDFLKPYQSRREYDDRDLQPELMDRFLKTGK